MTDIILTVILFAVSLGLFIIAALQFKEKGFLFNNAYIFATKEERETMDKKPYYRQSAIVFTLLGIIFLFDALEMVFKTGRLFYAAMITAVVTVVYAVASSCKLK